MTCYVCGDALDGTVCTECSRADVRERRAAVRARLAELTTVRARAATLRATLEAPALLGVLAREQAARVSLVAARARVAALRGCISTTRERIDAASNVVQLKRAFLDQKASRLAAAAAELAAETDAAPSRLSAAAEVLRRRNARLKEELTAARRVTVAELMVLLPVGASPRAPTLDTAVVNVALPNTGNYADVDPSALSAAMGYVLQIVGLLCRILLVAPPTAWRLCGASSAIWLVADDPSPQTYPLFFDRVVEDLRGVQLVNATVVFVAGTLGIAVPPEEERQTLPNLLKILRLLGQQSLSPTSTSTSGSPIVTTTSSTDTRMRSASMPSGERPDVIPLVLHQHK